MSYLWPLTWGSSSYFPDASFWERQAMLLQVQPFAVMGAGVRAVLWAPSLVTWWYANPPGYSFGQWLAPGLYIEPVLIVQSYG